jgi:Na+-driven multidrug efflux pump
VNVLFNALLINGLFFFPKLGVTGAAVATMLGNFCAMLMSLRSVRQKGGYLFLSFRRLFSLRFESLGPVLRVFAGAACEQVFLRIGFFTFAKTIANLGTV